MSEHRHELAILKHRRGNVVAQCSECGEEYTVEEIERRLNATESLSAEDADKIAEMKLSDDVIEYVTGESNSYPKRFIKNKAPMSPFEALAYLGPKIAQLEAECAKNLTLATEEQKLRYRLETELEDKEETILGYIQLGYSIYNKDEEIQGLKAENAGLLLMEAEGQEFAATIVRENEALKAELEHAKADIAAYDASNRLLDEQLQQAQAEIEMLEACLMHALNDAAGWDLEAKAMIEPFNRMTYFKKHKVTCEQLEQSRQREARLQGTLELGVEDVDQLLKEYDEHVQALEE